MNKQYKVYEDAKHHTVLSTSFWALLQMVFLQVGALATTMYVTRMMSTTEYGFIPLVNSLVLLLVVFVGLGLPSSVARFLAAQDSKVNQRVVLVRALAGGAPWITFSTICIILLFPFITEILGEPRLAELQWVFIFVLILELVRLFLEKVCHGTGNMRISANFSGWASLFVVIITVPAVWHTPTALMAFFAKIIALIIPSIRAAWALKRALEGNNLGLVNDELPCFKEMMGYGLPLAVISLSGFGFVQMDILLLAYYKDTSIVGLYSVGVLLLVKLTALSRAIGFGISPSYAEQNNNKLEQASYFIFGLKYALIVAIPLAIFLAVEGGTVMALLFGGQYFQAADALSILCIYFIMSSVLAVASPVLDFGGKAKVRAYGAFSGALVNLLLNVLLIPRYGAVGAAIATVCGYGILFGVTFKALRGLISVSLLRSSALLKLVVLVGPGLLGAMLLVNILDVVALIRIFLSLNDGVLLWADSIFNEYVLFWVNSLSNEYVSFWINFCLLVLAYPSAIYWFGIISKTEFIGIKRIILGK